MNYRIKNQKGKAKALPVKRSQKAYLPVEGGELVDSRDDGSLKVTTTMVAAPEIRGWPRKVDQESLDQDSEESTSPVPVIARAATKKRTTPSGSNDSKIWGTWMQKAAAAVQNSGDDDEEKDKEITVSGDIED